MRGSPGFGLSWSELDELADYAAGMLTGAPAERVAALVRTDERWAAAHAALTAAEPLVRTALQAAAAAPPSLPDDVAARLDAIVDEPARHSRRSQGRVRRHPVGAGRPSGSPSRSRPGTAPRRSRRVVLGRVAAAVLALVAVGGVTTLARQLLSTDMPEFSAADAPSAESVDAGSAPQGPGSAAIPAPVDDLAPTQIISSGTDYRRETLPQIADWTRPLDASKAPSAFRDSALSGLAMPDQLQACLAAVGHVHPGSVVVVDYARFEGEPAVILLVRRSGAPIVVAVGPSCGLAGADILATVELP